MPTGDRLLPIVLLITVFAVLVIVLVLVLVRSTVRQQRRYLRTRDHLGGRLLTAQDEERAAIARELHDDVVNRLNLLSKGLKDNGEFILAAKLIAPLDDLARDVRALSRGIHPGVVDTLGLNPALRELAASIGTKESMEVLYTGPPEEWDDLLPAQRLAFYRVAQEALGNVARHAKVQFAVMTLSRDVTGTRLVIADQGRGFDREAAASNRGIGVTSMGERLGILGGTLSVDSGPGRGTEITAFLPVAPTVS